jgi:choline dehydrogenase-like flavoprotein
VVASSYDVVVVGAGGDGPVAAWKLAEAGLSVLVLEAGPFYGNEQWPKPSEAPGGEASSSVDDLASIAAEILREAGAAHVHRSDSPPTALHLHSTMRMGMVVDEACEAHDVERLFVADHSGLANGVGGAYPTNTGQALAARTAEPIVERYFGD